MITKGQYSKPHLHEVELNALFSRVGNAPIKHTMLVRCGSNYSGRNVQNPLDVPRLVIRLGINESHPGKTP